MRSWCSGAATATRSQSGPRPGKVSPRRTTMPRSRRRPRTRVASRTCSSRNGARPSGTTATPGSWPRAAARPARQAATCRAWSSAQATAPGWRAGDQGLQGQAVDRPGRLGGGQPGGQLRAGQQVADPEAGQAPGLGQAAHHHQPGEVPAGGQGCGFAGDGVGEGLVHHQDPARAGQPFQDLDRVQPRCGVGRVAEHDQVGVGRHQVGVELERVRQQDPLDPVAGRAQGRLGGGERGVDADRPPRPQPAGQQGERLGGPVGQQHLGRVAPVAGGHRLPGRGGPRVGRETGHGVPEPGLEPGRRPGQADVDRQVELAGSRLRVEVVVAVMVEVDGHGRRR